MRSDEREVEGRVEFTLCSCASVGDRVLVWSGNVFPPLDATHHRLSTNQKLWHLSAVHAEPLNTWLLGWCACKYLTADIGGSVRERVEFCWNESRWCHGEVWIHRTGFGVGREIRVVIWCAILTT
jgi:hypothetical protein